MCYLGEPQREVDELVGYTVTRGDDRTVHVCDPESPGCAQAHAEIEATRAATGHVCDFTIPDCAVHLFYAHPSNRDLFGTK